MLCMTTPHIVLKIEHVYHARQSIQTLLCFAVGICILQRRAVLEVGFHNRVAKPLFWNAT